MSNSLVGCSHVVFFQEFKQLFNLNKWKIDCFYGATSMPIFHEEMIKHTEKASRQSKTVFLFPFRSVGFNTIHTWMSDGLSSSNFYDRRMDHKLFVKSCDNPEKWYIDKTLLKDTRISIIQNDFFKKWLSFYERYENVKFVFWCHFGAWWGSQKENQKLVYGNHISYPELRNLYPNKSVDLEEFAASYNGTLFRDSDWHPTQECILAFITYLETNY